MLQVLTFIFVICLVFLIGFSRAFLGAHSIDQIIYGWSLGLWMSCSLFFIFYPIIAFFIKSKEPMNQENIKEREARKQKNTISIIVAMSFFIMLIIIAVVAYRIVENNVLP